METIVSFSKVRKVFGENEVLRDVTIDVAEGGAVALIGRSGSGKSTLLRCVNGLERIDHGELWVCGHALHARKPNLRHLRTEVGIVFQSYNLFPHLSVAENVMLAPRKVRKFGRAEARDLAAETLRQVGLSEKIDEYPEQLSGGQQQRVAIARCLAMQPKLMLFDEVTSALDPEYTREVLRTIEALAADGMTMLVVTHEMNLARSLGGKVLFMHRGEIWEQGPSTMLDTPRSEELRQFVGSGL